ncbi:MAG: pseudaminic acid cytidylyltransferase [Candidatus Paceibacterota bacterium]|jgi:N-acylneuraminate cytidylyltransferase
MKILAIIPARGGSKRIPRKNIKSFLGQPIIKYSIDAAKESAIFDEIMVSTDDLEIEEVAKSSGAVVPFLRSKENSTDRSATAPVLEEVILEYKKLGKDFDYICCIYPTAIFVTGERLRLAKQMILDKDADAVIPVMRFGYPIQRALKIKEDGKVEMFWPENYSARSQDLGSAYHDCGQFYFLKVSNFLKQKVLFPKLSVPLEVPESEAQDIDNEEDWKLAEIKFNLLKNYKRS